MTSILSEKWKAIAGLPMVAESTKLMEAMKMAKVTVTQATPKELPGIKDDVFGIKNESPVIAELILLLGIPNDGTAYKIRTGFMSYDEKTKMLFFSKNKYDLPGYVGKRPEK